MFNFVFIIIIVIKDIDLDQKQMTKQFQIANVAKSWENYSFCDFFEVQSNLVGRIQVCR